MAWPCREPSVYEAEHSQWKTWKHLVALGFAKVSVLTRRQQVTSANGSVALTRRSEHMCLLGSHSWIWVLDQAYCKFISQPSEYEHGDKGGMWYFSLVKIIPVIDGYKYRHIIVVAGSARKLMYLPSESQLLCPDFTESMVRDPARWLGHCEL